MVWRQRRRGRRGNMDNMDSSNDDHDDQVVFEILSIARSSGTGGLLGRLAFPLNRGMQARFFGEQLRCMRRLVSAVASGECLID